MNREEAIQAVVAKAIANVMRDVGGNYVASVRIDVKQGQDGFQAGATATVKIGSIVTEREL